GFRCRAAFHRKRGTGGGRRRSSQSAGTCGGNPAGIQPEERLRTLSIAPGAAWRPAERYRSSGDRADGRADEPPAGASGDGTADRTRLSKRGLAGEALSVEQCAVAARIPDVEHRERTSRGRTAS